MEVIEIIQQLLKLLFCDKNNIETLWGIGGNKKSNSSSWILKKWNNKN